MSTGSPDEDNGGEPAPSPDPWTQSADSGQPDPAAAVPPTQPAQPAQPAQPPYDSGGFSSGAPQDWSASTPASWSSPEPEPAAPSQPTQPIEPAAPSQSTQPTQPVQSAAPSQPTQPTLPAQPGPPQPNPFTPAAWPGSRDAPAAHQPTGNGFNPAGSDPWTGQPAGFSQPGGPYRTPAAAYYPPAPVRTNRLAIAALVCGLTQFFLGLFALNFLLAIPAIICGAIGMRQTSQRGEGGRGLSIAGLVLGILGIVWNVLYVVLILVFTHRS